MCGKAMLQFSNLPVDKERIDYYNLFVKYGNIVKLFVDRGKKFGKVYYSYEKDAYTAFNKLNGQPPFNLTVSHPINLQDVSILLEGMPENVKMNKTTVKTDVSCENYVDIFGRVVSTFQLKDGEVYVSLAELKKIGLQLFPTEDLRKYTKHNDVDEQQMLQFELDVKTKATEFMPQNKLSIAKDKCIVNECTSEFSNHMCKIGLVEVDDINRPLMLDPEPQNINSDKLHFADIKKAFAQAHRKRLDNKGSPTKTTQKIHRNETDGTSSDSCRETSQQKSQLSITENYQVPSTISKDQGKNCDYKTQADQSKVHKYFIKNSGSKTYYNCNYGDQRVSQQSKSDVKDVFQGTYKNETSPSYSEWSEARAYENSPMPKNHQGVKNQNVNVFENSLNSNASKTTALGDRTIRHWKIGTCFDESSEESANSKNYQKGQICMDESNMANNNSDDKVAIQKSYGSLSMIETEDDTDYSEKVDKTRTQFPNNTRNQYNDEQLNYPFNDHDRKENTDLMKDDKIDTAQNQTKNLSFVNSYQSNEAGIYENDLSDRIVHDTEEEDNENHCVEQKTSTAIESSISTAKDQITMEQKLTARSILATNCLHQFSNENCTVNCTESLESSNNVEDKMEEGSSISVSNILTKQMQLDKYDDDLLRAINKISDFQTLEISKVPGEVYDFVIDNDIRCMCQTRVNFKLIDLVMCIKCLTLQHCACLGYLYIKDVPDEYFCQRCVLDFPLTIAQEEHMQQTSIYRLIVALAYFSNKFPTEVLDVFNKEITASMIEKFKMVRILVLDGGEYVLNIDLIRSCFLEKLFKSRNGTSVDSSSTTSGSFEWGI